MNRFLLAVSGLGVMAAGAAPAFAGPTQDQMSAEWLEPATPGSGYAPYSGVAVPGKPAYATTGAAELRMQRLQQQDQGQQVGR